MRNPFLLPMRDSLLRKLMATTPPEPRKPKKPKGKKGGEWNVTQPDGFILEIRRLREQCGWTRARIQQWAAQQGYPINSDRVGKILDYSTRSSLVPDITDKPYHP